jgi:signal transduction histidine kinase
VHPDDLPKCLETYESAFDERREFQMEYRLRRRDGEYRWLLDRGVPLSRPGGEFGGYIGSCIDITARRRLETQLVEIAEREQRRIGQDLHDGLGQQLTGMVFLNNVLHEKLAQQSLPEAADAARLGELLGETRLQVRELARGLNPFPIEPNGLVGALTRLAESTAQLHRVTCHLECPRPVLIHDNHVATHLFRIAQEAVTNALRHGKRVRTITLFLIENSHTLQLLIQDDGGRWRRRREQPAGLGVSIMSYRAEAVGGTLDIRTVRPRGTLVRCGVPVAPTNHLRAHNS